MCVQCTHCAVQAKDQYKWPCKEYEAIFLRVLTVKKTFFYQAMKKMSDQNVIEQKNGPTLKKNVPIDHSTRSV